MENSHIYPLCDILCVNETEAHLMTKLRVDSLDDCIIACKMILDKGCGAVVLTMGANGALYVNRLQTLHIPVPTKVDPVDTTVIISSPIIQIIFSNFSFCILRVLAILSWDLWHTILFIIHTSTFTNKSSVAILSPHVLFCGQVPKKAIHTSMNCPLNYSNEWAIVFFH